MRNMAIYQDKVFVATTDARLVALDARTGKKVWDTPIADRAKGYANTAADRHEGHGRQGPASAAIATATTAAASAPTTRRPASSCGSSTPSRARDEPGGDTWGKLADNLRIGGETWIAGSYDPDLDLTYWGVAQAKPWMRASRGTSNFDNVALHELHASRCTPKDGTLAWHYQHAPGESLDLDEVFERVLVDIGDQKVVFTIGKPGILWKLDRRTGKFLGYKETVFQNVFESIDPKTGAPTYRADILEQQIGQWVAVVPEHRRRPQLAGDELSSSRPALLDHSAQPVVHGDVGPQDRVRRTAPAAPAPIAASSRCPAATATSASSPPTT